MVKFCYDQYDHPLLWCDEKRRVVQREIARQDMETVQEKKIQEQIDKIRDQQELTEMLINNCPWGKPGGGAPARHIRRTNILMSGLYPDSNSDCRKYTYPSYRRAAKLMGGGGAPVYSSTGRLLTTFRNDPMLTFSDSMRTHVDNDLRYKTTPKIKNNYRRELDKIVAEKAQRNRKSIDMPKHDPWGKSGPGGLPWRHPSQIGRSFMKSMGWTDQDELKLIDLETNIDLFCDDYKNDKMKNMTYHCCLDCQCNCLPKGTIICDGTDKEKMQQSQTGANDAANHSENLLDKKGEHIKCTKKLLKDRPTRTCMITGGIELVPLLAKRRALCRPITLSTTDVTHNPYNNFHKNDMHHLDALCRQMHQKQRKRQLIRESDMESSRRHFETLDTYWGRPGHGAPRCIRNKLNLNDLLYNINLT